MEKTTFFSIFRATLFSSNFKNLRKIKFSPKNEVFGKGTTKFLKPGPIIILFLSAAITNSFKFTTRRGYKEIFWDYRSLLPILVPVPSSNFLDLRPTGTKNKVFGSILKTGNELSKYLLFFI